MEDKKEVKTTLTKTKTVSVETKKGGSYSYRYTELADINQYIEEIGETYYQYIDRIETDDYIMTVRIKDEKESTPRRGCRIVQANLQEYSNPAQEQGSALTYARRYSLLMAYGLATEDDDAQGLNKPKKEVKMETLEDAEQYVITFGKHKGKTLKEIMESDTSYIDWLFNSERTDEIIKTAICLITGEAIPTEETQKEKLELIVKLGSLMTQKNLNRNSLYKKYKVESDTELTIEQLKEAIATLEN